MRQAVFLVGPTACGKTAVSLEVALRLPVEIVSLDSMNVYRGMDIGTAKPTTAERETVRHHLIDVVDPDASFSVGRYVVEAAKAVDGIRRRGKYPLFVGGTSLYLKAMTRGLFPGPPADRELRAVLHERAGREGTATLHEELHQVDPAAALRIHPNDLKRIVRALEVVRTTGRPISEWQTEWSTPQTDTHVPIVGIACDRDELYRRIDARVDRMFAAGLVDEVRTLLGRFGKLGRQSSQAVGYREVLAHLFGGTDLAQTVALVKRNTRRMAKRQLTWFRSFGSIRWFTMEPETSPLTVAREMAEELTPEMSAWSAGDAN